MKLKLAWLATHGVEGMKVSLFRSTGSDRVAVEGAAETSTSTYNLYDKSPY